MTKEINRKLLPEELERALFWLIKNNVSREAVALHFKISVESLERQLDIKPRINNPLDEALNMLGTII